MQKENDVSFWIRAAKWLGKAVFVLAFWGFVWYLLSSRAGVDLIFPSPKAVFHELGLLLTNRSESLIRYGIEYNFWLITAISMLRIIWGVLISILLGTLLAYLTSISKLLNLLISPVLSVIKATPVASFIMLALLWMERSILPVFITALIVIPIVWANVSEGIQAVDPQLTEVARIYRFSLVKRIKRLYVPSIAPYFFAACRSALGMAWKAGVAAEILAIPDHAIGTEIYTSQQYIMPQTLFAWTLIVILLSFLIEKLFIWGLEKLGQRLRILRKGERHAEH